LDSRRIQFSRRDFEFNSSLNSSMHSIMRTFRPRMLLLALRNLGESMRQTMAGTYSPA
jgi:hypothetical protein